VTTHSSSVSADVIDAVVGLTPDNPLHATRHARAKVAAATQGSYDLFFDPEYKGDFSVQERLLVAYYACLLSKSQDLGRHYHQALLDLRTDASVLQALASHQTGQLDSKRLKALLLFTQKLIERPVDGDQAALKALQAAGMATPDIVTLAQLIAFLSYQLRLTAGLQAMKALEAQP